MHESIPARPRGDKRDGGVNYRTDGGRPKNSFPRTVDDLNDNDDEELDTACDEATRESILARTRGAKRDSDAKDRTDGGCPKIALLKTTSDLAYDDEELDDGDTEDEEDLEDDGGTAPIVWAGNPPPPCVDGIVWLDGGVWFYHRRQKPGENQTGRKRCRFYPGNSRGGPPGTPVRKRGRGPWCSDPGTPDR